MKSLILKQTPKSKLAALSEEISAGARAHNLDYLKGNLIRKGISVPDAISESVNIIKNEWTTDLRYVGAMIPEIEAAFFIKQVDILYRWVDRGT